jgi:hypothetical protein
MCYRLLAAVHLGASPAPDALAQLEQLAAALGLDMRTSPSGPEHGYVEIAWGDCACSLYSTKAGRERAVGFVEALLQRGEHLHLLLFTDAEPPQLSPSPPEKVALECFRTQGLQALPEGRACVLVGSLGPSPPRGLAH